jgi:hypothetical protein
MISGSIFGTKVCHVQAEGEAICAVVQALNCPTRVICVRNSESTADPDSYDLWLDPGMQDVAAISELLRPYDARSMWCYPVSTRVNSVIER